MDIWSEELALVESAAIRIEGIEVAAKRCFDEAHARASSGGDAERALTGPEFAAWMAARHDTDAAWGRWWMVMEARPRGA